MRAPIPLAANAVIFTGMLGLQLAQFLIIPLLPSQWAWVLVLTTASTTTLWALMHEAIHNHLFPGKWNRVAGVTLATVFGSSFSFLQRGHLTHHSVNRTPVEQLEILRSKETPMMAAAIYYAFLGGGLYLAEIVVPFLFWLPKSWNVIGKLKIGDFGELVLSKLNSDEAIRRIRVENLLVVGFFGASTWLYWDRLELLAAVIAARALLISALDYIYHYETPVGDPTHAMDLRLPSWLSATILHFNCHHAHHLHPSLPWNALPQLAHPSMSWWKAAARAWKGPLQRDQIPKADVCPDTANIRRRQRGTSMPSPASSNSADIARSISRTSP